MTRSEADDVRQARELLESLLSRGNAHVIYPFLNQIDPDVLQLDDYEKVVTSPMWLKKMSQTFDAGEYQSIREFACDFRLMLLNCYRYNGVNSRMGRMAEKLELLFEQKLQLLSPEIRSKTSIQSTLGQDSAEQQLNDYNLPRRRSTNRLFALGDSRQMTPMRTIMEELEHPLQSDGGTVTASLLSTLFTDTAHSGTIDSERFVAIMVSRLTQWRARREDDLLLKTWDTWWTEQNGFESLRVIRRTPEFLEIYQFLWLADPFLGITDCLSHPVSPTMDPPTPHRDSPALELFDLELAMSVNPQSSHLLTVCMSNLLATPKERNQLVSALSNETPDQRRGTLRTSGSSLSLLDYDTWERRLAELVASWYRSLCEKGKGSVLWAARRLGLPPWFFERCGSQRSPLDGRRFHELPVYIRIQLFYALCESVLRNFENLRLSLDRDADWESSKPVTLGDNLFTGESYVHFPNMLNNEDAVSYRVYRIARLKNKPVDLGFPAVSSPSRCSPVLANSPKEDITPPSVDGLKKRQRRKRSARLSACSNAPKKKDAIAEHDRVLSETGLSVPGPVGRLPCWLAPPLSRSTCRRWYKIAERIHMETSTAAAQNPKGRKNAGSSWFEQFHQNNTKFKSPSVKRNSTKLVPFPSFQSSDTQRVRELLADDPLLVPSPFGMLNGSSRRFLSMQMSRCSSVRPQNKAARRTVGQKRSRPAAADNDVDEAASSTSVSRADMDSLDASSDDEQLAREQPPGSAARSNVEEEDDEDTMGKSDWLDEVNADERDFTQMKTDPDSQMKSTCDATLKNDPDTDDQHVPEDLALEPSTDDFALVADDAESLRNVVLHLQTFLQSVKEGNHTTDSGIAGPPQSDSDTDCACEKLKSSRKTCTQNGVVDQCTNSRCPLFRERSIQALEDLITQLERVVPFMTVSKPRREEAQQIARLHIRKQFSAWQQQEQHRKNDPDAPIEPQANTSPAVSQNDVAKERAERLKRREQLRFADPTEGTSSDDLDQTSDASPNHNHSMSHSANPTQPSFASSTSLGTNVRVSYPPYVPGLSVRATPPPEVTTTKPAFVTPSPVLNRVSQSGQSASSAPSHPSRRIYRVFDTLFTEDARPVCLESNGTIKPLPLDSVPTEHRLIAIRMIEKYKHQVQPQNPLIAPKRVAVTLGKTEQDS